MVYAARATRGHRFCGVSKTPGGRDFLLLSYFLFKSHDNGFGCCEVGKGHRFRFQEMEPMHDEGGLSMDSPRTDVGLLKTVPICLLGQKCPCEFA